MIRLHIICEGKTEEINEGADTAPSKRILREIPKYRKKYAVSPVLHEIGLDKIRQKCPHFNEWIEKMEKLSRAKKGE